ncbi:hypothetical protein AM493_05165 [Flavobacterium akiainvivens]|uniref:Uncharacterized protein n=1 Tax=Flavobacterium akiainvivens TaxID=1202724 RepID=A0A0M8MH50_9FLAO|nr:hypothetical protein [Flavobacterium akiainvivens]KOS05488.1 hypothetical protein AM493_05165 [Flavobacterium akiainvivens]SFQ32937.1 hypothetical protein SAMN05444144_10368 [Flavobacterium akiainvivens]
MKTISLYTTILATFLLFMSCADDNENEVNNCGVAISLQSYEQDGNTILLSYSESSDIATEASITTLSGNPNDGIILPVNNNEVDFSQAGLIPGNYGLYLRTPCSDGSNGNSNWTNIIPIIINEICDKPLTVNSISINGAILNRDITTDMTDMSYTLQIRFVSENGESKITEIPRQLWPLYDLIQRGIAPGTYSVSFRTVCEDGKKGGWTEPVEINIEDYHCLKPYNIQSTISGGGNVYIWWWNGSYDYAQWQYVIVPEGQPLESGTIITTDSPSLPLSNYSAKDIYVRGVCGENTYTDWVQVW